MNVLVVGGSSVSGQAIIQAARAVDPAGRVVSTSSSEDRAVSGADTTVPSIDLAERGAAARIAEQCSGEAFDYVVYVPARGEVGVPAHTATADKVRESLDYSVVPYLELHRRLTPRRTIALSGFITMDPMLLIYGSMTFTKIAMEQLAVNHPQQLQIVRVGMFLSKSVRGIALLVQRHMSRRMFPELAHVHDQWKQSGIRKFQDFFWDLNYRYERETYAAHSGGKEFRPTTPDDIRDTFVQVFRGVTEPIVNLLGAWRWMETGMPHLPPVVRENIGLIPDDLSRHLTES